MEITLNNDQKVYVLRHSGGGYSCFGFNNCFREAVAMAEIMNKHRRASTPPIEPPDARLHGTIECYQMHQQLLAAWARHPASKKTWFDPRTPAKVASILERAIRSHKEQGSNGQRLRLFLGDPVSGRDWCEENDVVGFIGRSCGIMKVPLLIEPLIDQWGDLVSASGGGAILTSNILRIIDVDTLDELYRATNYQTPELTFCHDSKNAEYPFWVRRDADTLAHFRSRVEAEQFVAFLQGHRVANKPRTVREYREDMLEAA